MSNCPINPPKIAEDLGYVKGKIEGTDQKLDLIIDAQKQLLKTHERLEEKYDGRVRSLELWRSYLAGGLAAVLLIVAITGYKMKDALAHISH